LSKGVSLDPKILNDVICHVPCELEAKRMINAPKARISKCKLEVLSNRGEKLCVGARFER
jgi:hypothetical protein